jgi:hypothetical protein
MPGRISRRAVNTGIGAAVLSPALAAMPASAQGGESIRIGFSSMLRSANELGLQPKMMGGGMVGLQATAIKNTLKFKLNGIVNYETWVPSAKLMAPAAGFFKKYQARPGPRHRPAGLLSRLMGLRLSAGARRRNRGREGRQRRRRGGLSAQPRVRYHHGVRHPIRHEWWMDQNPLVAGPISRHHRSGEPRELARHELSDGTHACGREDRRADYPYEKALAATRG